MRAIYDHFRYFVSHWRTLKSNLLMLLIVSSTVSLLLFAARSAQAEPLTDLQQVSQISAGGDHTCVVQNDNNLLCWGANLSGQLGDGKIIGFRTKPQTVLGLASGVRSVATGWQYSCAVMLSGIVKCWGDTSHGKLGNNLQINVNAAMDVVGINNAVSVTLGSYHACALTSVGGVKCWGGNYFGQLGNGTLTDSAIPVDVLGLTSGVTSIAAGNNHTCAILTGGTVKCWGRSASGSLGNNDASDGSVPNPVDVVNLTNANALALGDDFSCALTSVGGVKCWGSNDQGKVGDGSWPDSSGQANRRLIPVDVLGLTSGVVAISGQLSHTCALLTTGSLRCWGINASQQLGFETPLGYSNAPQDVTSVTGGIQAVTTGFYHTCVLLNDATVKCWGRNYEGQLGNGEIFAPTLIASTVIADDPMPETTLLTTPPNPSYNTNETFTFAATGGSGSYESFLCQLNNGAWFGCNNGGFILQDYINGMNTFRVSAVDSLHSLDATPAEYTWAVVVSPLPPTANAQSIVVNEDETIQITLTGSDPHGETLMFSLLNQPLHGTLSGANANLTYTPNANYYGTDSFQFVVNDGSLDSEPATVSITVNPVNDLPDTTLTGHPPSSSTVGDASFNFVGSDVDSDPLILECALDTSTFTLCSSPQNYTNLGNGLHSFSVRAVDSVAATDPTPATYSWTIQLPLTDIIFADGFESGGLAAWTTSTTDGGNLSVSANAALVGNQGLQALVNDNNPLYVTDETPNAEKHYRSRFLFDPNSINMRSGDAHFLFYGQQSDGQPVVRIELRRSKTLYQINTASRNDANTWKTSSWFTISDAPHVIEIDWLAATTTIAKNGGVTLWIDGAKKATVTGVDNDTRRIERVALGAVAGIDSDTRGTEYFDAFESHSQTYIGVPAGYVLSLASADDNSQQVTDPTLVATIPSGERGRIVGTLDGLLLEVTTTANPDQSPRRVEVNLAENFTTPEGYVRIGSTIQVKVLDATHKPISLSDWSVTLRITCDDPAQCAGANGELSLQQWDAKGDLWTIVTNSDHTEPQIVNAVITDTDGIALYRAESATGYRSYMPLIQR